MNPRSWTAVAALGDGPAAPPFTAAAVIAGCGIGQFIDGGGTVEFIAIPAAFIRSLCRWIISRTRGCAASLGSNPMSSSWCLRKTSTVSDLRVASCSCCWRIACTRAGCSEVISAGMSVAPTAASRSLAAAVSSRCRWSISASLCPWSFVPECSVSAWIRLAFVSATAATPVRMRSVIVPIMPPRAWSIMFVSERGRILLLVVAAAVVVVAAVVLVVAVVVVLSTAAFASPMVDGIGLPPASPPPPPPPWGGTRPAPRSAFANKSAGMLGGIPARPGICTPGMLCRPACCMDGRMESPLSG